MQLTVGTFVLTVLSSSVVASVLTSLVSVYIQRRQYTDEYYRAILQKRLEEYEMLAKSLMPIRACTYDDQHVPFYIAFYDAKHVRRFIAEMGQAHSGSIWIGEGTRKTLLDLGKLFVRIGEEFNLESDSQLAGKRYYKRVAELRDEIDKAIHTDLATLHRIPSFLQAGIDRESCWMTHEELFGQES